jgi:hypothetical protein
LFFGARRSGTVLNMSATLQARGFALASESAAHDFLEPHMTILRKVFAATLVLVAVTAAHAGPNVNIIVDGQISPGVYGRVELGSAPPPPVYYPQPVTIIRPPRAVVVEPIYLHVPPGHAKRWSRYCRNYDACGRPVYFVRSAEYEPGYRREHEDDRRGHGHGRGRGKDH